MALNQMEDRRDLIAAMHERIVKLATSCEEWLDLNHQHEQVTNDPWHYAGVRGHNAVGDIDGYQRDEAAELDQARHNEWVLLRAGLAELRGLIDELVPQTTAAAAS